MSYKTLVQLLLALGVVCSLYACGAWKQAPHVAGAGNPPSVADSMPNALHHSQMLCVCLQGKGKASAVDKGKSAASGKGKGTVQEEAATASDRSNTDPDHLTGLCGCHLATQITIMLGPC